MRKAIDSILAQDVPQNSFELIVVDNNSTDNTREVVTEFSIGHPTIRYLHEEKQGLSHARNRGLKEARGEYIVYIDDECILPPGYLALAFGIIDKIKPDIFGGPIKAYYDLKRPNWIKDEYFSEFLDQHSGNLSPEEFIYGGNIGIKTDTLKKLGGFNVNLGMKGNEVAFGEEIEFQRRAKGALPELLKYFDSDLWLYHQVRSEKMTWRWIVKQRFADGRDYYTLFRDKYKKNSVFRLIGRLVKNLLIFVLDLLFRVLIRDRKKYPYFQNYYYEHTTRYIAIFGEILQQLKEKTAYAKNK